MSLNAARILEAQGMPSREIRGVLGGGDRVHARRLLELHRERLGEWFEEQHALIAWIEGTLPEARGPAAQDPTIEGSTSPIGARITVSAT